MQDNCKNVLPECRSEETGFGERKGNQAKNKQRKSMSENA